MVFQHVGHHSNIGHRSHRALASLWVQRNPAPQNFDLNLIPIALWRFETWTYLRFWGDISWALFVNHLPSSSIHLFLLMVVGFFSCPGSEIRNIPKKIQFQFISAIGWEHQTYLQGRGNLISWLLQDFGIGHYKENVMKTTAGSSGLNFWGLGVLLTLSIFLHLKTRRLRAKQKESGRDPLQDLRVLDKDKNKKKPPDCSVVSRRWKNENNDKNKSKIKTISSVLAPVSVVEAWRILLQDSAIWQEWDQEPM